MKINTASRAVSEPRITAHLHTKILRALDWVLKEDSQIALTEYPLQLAWVRIVDRRACCSTGAIPQMAAAVLPTFPPFVSIGSERLCLLLAV
jgi:hypothetical protein